MPQLLAAVASLLMWGWTGNPTLSAQMIDYDLPPISYRDAPSRDAMARLAEKIETGALQLEFDKERGWLPALLKELAIPVSSQGLVFSKTSLQVHRIYPHRPRAVYFSDEVYVGWCQEGEVLEVAATDARLGAVFYTLDQTRADAPHITRDRGECLSCHASNRTQGIPGFLTRSIFPDALGRPVPGTASHVSTPSLPFADRWGGWYVSGQHGSMRHMGNAIALGEPPQLDRESAANVEKLDEFVSLQPYLSPHSDLVALMVLDHQTQMHNAIAAAQLETRIALHQCEEMNRILEREPGYRSESTTRRIEAAADRVVRHLLFHGEVRLESPIQGTSSFVTDFPARAVRDPAGRSLKDLDLQTRLLRYPCSYLIHSEAFAALPEEVLTKVLARTKEILDEGSTDPGYQHLTPAVRSELLAILGATTPWFPAGSSSAGTDQP